MVEPDLETGRDGGAQNLPVALTRVTLGTVLVFAGVWLLVVGKSILIPIVLAIFVWYLVEALTTFWKRVKIFGKRVPRLAPSLLTLGVIFAVAYGFLSLIATNVAAMVDAAPRYQTRLMELYQQIIAKFDIDETKLTDEVMARLDLGNVVGTLGGTLGGLLGNGILITMYVVFLLLERQFFGAKLDALIRDEGARQSVMKALARVDREVKMYLLVKMFVSLITAGGAYIIMRLTGLDFPEFWAVLIFVLNFIPYIGSTVATLLPTLLALAQFSTITQAVVIFVGIQAVQMTVGYAIEPAMTGKSLNISALAVMVSLAFWGGLWGIVGMFISVPITVVMMIICSHFEGTRAFAILLSRDGAYALERDPTRAG